MMRKIGLGSWVVVGILLGLLTMTAVSAVREWTFVSVQIPPYGYAVIGLGLFFSLAVGIGLMALIFYSSRHGYDEPPRRLQNDDDPR